MPQKQMRPSKKYTPQQNAASDAAFCADFCSLIGTCSFRCEPSPIGLRPTVEPPSAAPHGGFTFGIKQVRMDLFYSHPRSSSSGSGTSGISSSSSSLSSTSLRAPSVKIPSSFSLSSSRYAIPLALLTYNQESDTPEHDYLTYCADRCKILRARLCISLGIQSRHGTSRPALKAFPPHAAAIAGPQQAGASYRA